MKNLDHRNFDPVKVRKSVICSFPVEDSRSSLLGAFSLSFRTSRRLPVPRDLEMCRLYKSRWCFLMINKKNRSHSEYKRHTK